MNVTVIGAGHTGLAMAAHLTQAGEQVTLWNRSRKTVSLLMETGIIHRTGVSQGSVRVYQVTCDLEEALKDPDLILVTTPASAHRELAAAIAQYIKRPSVIVLNPGRTFGALEFQHVFGQTNQIPQTIAETQTNIYTVRKTAEDTIEILAIKDGVLISTFDAAENQAVLASLPLSLQTHFTPAVSMVETSIGNVGMILHCAPLLLNSGQTETGHYKYYREGITPSIARYLEQMDRERVEVSIALGHEVESTREWLIRIYDVTGDTLYECVQANETYANIDAPTTLNHRYMFEDVPNGLVPLEAAGQVLGVSMEYTSLIISLASRMLGTDFRATGRNLREMDLSDDPAVLRSYFERDEQ